MGLAFGAVLTNVLEKAGDRDLAGVIGDDIGARSTNVPGFAGDSLVVVGAAGLGIVMVGRF